MLLQREWQKHVASTLGASSKTNLVLLHNLEKNNNYILIYTRSALIHEEFSINQIKQFLVSKNVSKIATLGISIQFHSLNRMVFIK